MTAFNAVRFRVKPGREQEFLDAHEKIRRDWPGLQHVNMIKTGERTYCIIARWSDMDALAKARPEHDRDTRYFPRHARRSRRRAWRHRPCVGSGRVGVEIASRYWVMRTVPSKPSVFAYFVCFRTISGVCCVRLASSVEEYTMAAISLYEQRRAVRRVWRRLLRTHSQLISKIHRREDAIRDRQGLGERKKDGARIFRCRFGRA